MGQHTLHLATAGWVVAPFCRLRTGGRGLWWRGAVSQGPHDQVPDGCVGRCSTCPGPAGTGRNTWSLPAADPADRWGVAGAGRRILRHAQAVSELASRGAPQAGLCTTILPAGAVTSPGVLRQPRQLRRHPPRASLSGGPDPGRSAVAPRLRAGIGDGPLRLRRTAVVLLTGPLGHCRGGPGGECGLYPERCSQMACGHGIGL